MHIVYKQIYIWSICGIKISWGRIKLGGEMPNEAP